MMKPLLDAFDPTTITDPTLRAVFQALMNQVETLHEQTRTQAAEIQRLRDEIARLKGEQGKPDIKPSRPPEEQTDRSSEAERKPPRTPRGKRAKNQELTVTREEVVQVDPTTLPEDAQFKGHQPVVVQDILLSSEVIRFLKEKYYSPDQQQTYTAPLPPGYDGQFGPNTRALALTLYYDSGLSMPKIQALFALAGVQISAGQVAALLTQEHEPFHDERQDILAAGLESAPWQHIDTTATRVDGVNQHCHVVCNPLYTVYLTLPRKDRLSALDALRGGAPRRFRLDASAESLMCLLGVPARDQKLLRELPQDRAISEVELEVYLDTHLPRLTHQHRKNVKDALAIAAYHAHDTPLLPIVQTLVCDDAPQFAMLTEEIALCWIHDGRHYKELAPRLAHHKEQLTTFLTKYWNYYHGLRRYRDDPTAAKAERLRRGFDKLFQPTTGYEALDKRIAITRQKRQSLLRVLDHPELPLHNNPAELGARQRVRKRDISFGPRSDAGTRAWDTFQTLADTARKLGVNSYHYLRDRICGAPDLQRLADRIAEQADALALGASWPERAPRPAWQPVLVQSWRR
jgi:hypothetical protein